MRYSRLYPAILSLAAAVLGIYSPESASAKPLPYFCSSFDARLVRPNLDQGAGHANPLDLRAGDIDLSGDAKYGEAVAMVVAAIQMGDRRMIVADHMAFCNLAGAGAVRDLPAKAGSHSYTALIDQGPYAGSFKILFEATWYAGASASAVAEEIIRFGLPKGARKFKTVREIRGLGESRRLRPSRLRPGSAPSS